MLEALKPARGLRSRPQARRTSLTHPIYAGAYAFGRTTSRISVVDGRKRVRRGVHRPMDEWDVARRTIGHLDNRQPGVPGPPRPLQLDGARGKIDGKAIQAQRAVAIVALALPPQDHL